MRHQAQRGNGALTKCCYSVPMKAVIFALIVLLGIDVGVYHSAHLHALRENVAAFGDSIGEWVYLPS